LSRASQRLTRALLALALCTATAAAHDGPPYPIFVDEPLGGWTVSVWTDPDVGTGTFYYYLEPPPGADPDSVRIEVSAFPSDDPTARVEGLSVPAEPGEPFQQFGTLDFHHRETWPTHFVLRATDDPARVLGELGWDLEVTPPGLGTVDILWFAFPFLALGAIWLRALLAQLAHDRAQQPSTNELP